MGISQMQVYFVEILLNGNAGKFETEMASTLELS
jgi:hypothetical protein